MVDVWQHRVIYGEIDGQRIAFNARYLEWIDAASYEFFRLGGWSPLSLAEIDFDYVVVHCDLSFTAPIRLDEILLVKGEVTAIGRSSFELSYRIVVENELRATARLTYVNAQNGKATAIPSTVRHFLEDRRAATAESTRER